MIQRVKYIATQGDTIYKKQSTLNYKPVNGSSIYFKKSNISLVASKVYTKKDILEVHFNLNDRSWINPSIIME